MNLVLKEIIATHEVRRGDEVVRLHSNMDPGEGALINRVFIEVKPDVSLEVGMAYGISTLFVCDALSANGKPCRHIALDPFQMTDWRGLGLYNVERAGYAKFIELRQEKSELGLPKLLSEGVSIDCAVIDGWHTFDHALVDFFYVNKMLRIGGIVILDDTDWPSINRLTKHILSYPCYELFGVAGAPVFSVKLHAKVRRFIANTLNISSLKRPWEIKQPSAMAFRKIANDDRTWTWHEDF